MATKTKTKKKKAELFQCANCQWNGKEDDMNKLLDPLKRCEPSDMMPFGECPECGAACFLKEVEQKVKHPGHPGPRWIQVPAHHLEDMIVKADKALDGDSNDDEHDTLYALRERLAEFLGVHG
jgi:hypothetical protein